MGVGAGLYMYDLVKKFTFAISSPDEFLFINCSLQVFYRFVHIAINHHA